MTLDEFREYMSTHDTAEEDSVIFRAFNQLSEEARKITTRLNGQYWDMPTIRRLFSALIGSPVDDEFRLFPPFYTDCGKNIHVGRNVFINACCNFQDQGGVYIGDDVLIGHAVVFATLNHSEDPARRADLSWKPIHVEDNVWIGSNATILPGVTIGRGAIVGAGAVVTRDVPPERVATGVPARVRRVARRSRH